MPRESRSHGADLNSMLPSLFSSVSRFANAHLDQKWITKGRSTQELFRSVVNVEHSNVNRSKHSLPIQYTSWWPFPHKGNLIGQPGHVTRDSVTSCQVLLWWWWRCWWWWWWYRSRQQMLGSVMIWQLYKWTLLQYITCITACFVLMEAMLNFIKCLFCVRWWWSHHHLWLAYVKLSFSPAVNHFIMINYFYFF